ncbi:MAG: hypothetical protein AAGE05_07245 [Pseudomonadota bacterium]
MRPVFRLLALSILIAGCSPIGEEAAVAQEEAEVAAYPATAVLDAFRTACSYLASLEEAEAQILASGWVGVAEPLESPVGPVVQFGREAGAEMLRESGGTMSPMAVFSREVAGEELYLILSRVDVAENSVTGCRLFDIDETRSISIDAAADWLDRTPDRQRDSEQLVQAEWRPGLIEGQDSFELFFVPQGSPALQITQVSGLAMKVDQIGFTE